MRAPARLRNEDGVALMLVLLLTLAVGAMSMAAITMVGNATLVNAYSSRLAQMEDAAMSGVELGRSLVNRVPAHFPAGGYRELPAADLPLRDADGKAIPGLTRRVFVGPTGVTTGQYGVFGSVVSVVEDGAGNRVVFRGEMGQESFAKFAYFTDVEGDIVFARGDRIDGPVHSNDQIKISTSGSGKATFLGPVSTHQGIQNAADADFRGGKRTEVPRIELPALADLDRLKGLAALGGTAFASTGDGGEGQATTRIEFLAIDLNDDGDTADENEGFFKVYRAKPTYADGPRWVVAGVPDDGIWRSNNCVHRDYSEDRSTWGNYSAVRHNNVSVPLLGKKLEPVEDMLRDNVEVPRCHLGGADEINEKGQFVAGDARGGWVKNAGSWTGGKPQRVADRADHEYIFPLGRAYNPSFKGVIHVAGKVAISGELRGRVTLAASGNIVIADDVTYSTDPSAASCTDILGLFSGGDIVVADNSLNAPADRDPDGDQVRYRTFDDTGDEAIHAVLLTLGSFTAENYDAGSEDAEKCGASSAGRGCLYVTGGIIQATRGAVGRTSGTGYLKRYSYDACAAASPPPYFPTTGYFARGREYEVNPIGFDVDEYFRRLSARP